MRQCTETLAFSCKNRNSTPTEGFHAASVFFTPADTVPATRHNQHRAPLGPAGADPGGTLWWMQPISFPCPEPRAWHERYLSSQRCSRDGAESLGAIWVCVLQQLISGRVPEACTLFLQGKLNHSFTIKEAKTV